MGGVVAILKGSKDNILAEKMRKRQEAAENDNEKDQEERRRNSLVNDIEDWLNGKVEPFEPKIEEKKAPKKKRKMIQTQIQIVVIVILMMMKKKKSRWIHVLPLWRL